MVSSWFGGWFWGVINCNDRLDKLSLLDNFVKYNKKRLKPFWRALGAKVDLLFNYFL